MLVSNRVGITIRSRLPLKVRLEKQNHMLAPHAILIKRSIGAPSGVTDPVFSNIGTTAVIENRYRAESVLAIGGIGKYLARVLEGSPNLE